MPAALEFWHRLLPHAPMEKSFLVLFFKKEPLFSLTSPLPCTPGIPEPCERVTMD
jgi:hypothetical protein